MDRSVRRWFACLVATPLGLMSLGGCGGSTAEPAAHVEAERGIPPLLLPRAEALHSLNSDPHQYAVRTTLTDRMIVPETPRRLPPVEDLAQNQPQPGAITSMRIAKADSECDKQDDFQIIPLPPANEAYGASEATPYLASLPQSVMVQPGEDPSSETASGPEMPELNWPREQELADPNEADHDQPAPVAEAEPQLDADLEIGEPAESATIPKLNESSLPSIARPDKSHEIRPLPPVNDSETRSPESALVEVPVRNDKSDKVSSPTAANSSDRALSERAKAMRVVSEQAAVHVRRGISLASRNAHYSARSEFIQALRMISQALDVANDSHEYTEALSDGLRALDEADDFVPRGTQLEADLNLAVLIRSHRTPVLKEADPQSLRPIFARQEYYNYAQKQLAHCAEGDRSGSMALYGLAKIRASVAEQQPDLAMQELPKAMALYQSAMLVDGENYMASNELGVLLARYGQYESAQAMLEHSVRTQPQIGSWHNLAVVYEHLGKTEEMKFARSKQAELTDALRTSKKPSAEVTWKTPEEFNRTTSRTQAPVAQTPAKTASETQQKNDNRAVSR